VKLAELSNSSFEWKNVTFYGVETYSDPSYIFSGGQDPEPSMIYAPASIYPLSKFVETVSRS